MDADLLVNKLHVLVLHLAPNKENDPNSKRDEPNPGAPVGDSADTVCVISFFNTRAVSTDDSVLSSERDTENNEND